MQPASRSRTNEWCIVAETRLITRVILHKPVGGAKSPSMRALVADMKNIAENDEFTNFKTDLTEADYILHSNRCRTGEVNQTRPRLYEPAYKVRPNAKEIEAKLNEYFDLDLIRQMESKQVKRGIKRKSVS